MCFRISLQPAWQINNGVFDRPILARIQILIHRWPPRTRVSGQDCFADNLYLSRSLVPSAVQANTSAKTMKNKKKPKQWRIKNTQRIFTTVKPNFNPKYLNASDTQFNILFITKCWTVHHAILDVKLVQWKYRQAPFCSRSCNLCLTMTVNLSHSLSSNNC